MRFMKRTLLFCLALFISFGAAVPSNRAAGTARENQRLQQGKITKNEAQHLVLKQFPGAKVKKCILTSGPDHGIWVLDIVKAGTRETTKVQVDGQSGKILP